MTPRADGGGSDRRTARRIYAREYARRRRAQAQAARNASASVCQLRAGRFGRCGGALECITDGAGRMAVVCRRCERRRKGICRDCARPVAGAVGKSLRCAYHTAVVKVKHYREYKARNGATLRARARAYYRDDAERRERKNARKKLWRLAHPEKVKAYKRREGLSQNPNRREYHRKRRERERAELAARERARQRGITEVRTCVTSGCDAVMTGHARKCPACKERTRLDAIARIAELNAGAQHSTRRVA